MKCYFPYDEKSTIKILKQTNSGVNYVRLCLDDQVHEIYTLHNNSLKVVTIGWLVEYINQIKTKYNLDIDVVPLVEFFDIFRFKEKFVFIYDNFKLNVQIQNCIAQYCISNNPECIGMNRQQTLQKYYFDEKSILKYFKNLKINQIVD